MRLVSLAEGNPLGQRNAALHQSRTQKDLDIEFAHQALTRDEVVCPVEARELNLRLTSLYRKVRSDLAEGGSNTLYLAVGFLRWKQKPADTDSYRAPLILVPVKLIRRSASSPYYLANHEDDVRFNATLLQMLKKDFDCDLTRLEQELPMDDSGVNVPLVLERMRQGVRDIPGFEVIEEAAIAPFSFAKYLMWKDLVERVGQLEHNRVVSHLIHNPDKPFVSGGNGPMPKPHEIDVRYTPADIVHPLPADSSQLSAVMAASEGHDMVIVGPPGTGKSQTIANLIAQCLSVGKTVLFVAEKTAALDVVHRRLREHGLGDCCVELHSNKAERRRFLDQLEASWKNRRTADVSEWVTISKQLRVQRDKLNAYAASLHTTESNGWTAYRAMGEFVRGRAVDAPPLEWPLTLEHDCDAYAELEKVVAEIASTCQAIPAGVSLPQVQATEWSMAWETELLKSARQLIDACRAFGPALSRLSTLLGASMLSDISAAQLTPLYRLAFELAKPALPLAEVLLNGQLEVLKAKLVERGKLLQLHHQESARLDAALTTFGASLGLSQSDALVESRRPMLYRLANELVRADLPPEDLVYHVHFESAVATLAERPARLRDRDQAIEALAARSFNPALIAHLPADALESDWRKASDSIWPISAWRKKSVKKQIQALMSASGNAEPTIDLPLIQKYREACGRLATDLESLGLSSQLQKALEQDPSALDLQIQSASRMRNAIHAAGLSPESIGDISQRTLQPLTVAARGLYAPGREVEALRVKLNDNLKSLGLSEELQTMVKADATGIDAQLQSAHNIRAGVTALVAAELQEETLQAILSAEPNSRRSASGDCCQSAKAFQNEWIAYTKTALATPVEVTAPSAVSVAERAAQEVIQRRTALKQWTAWTAVRRRAEKHGLSDFVEPIQSQCLKASEAVSRFRLAYARWWLPALIDRRDPLREFQKFMHEGAIDEFCRLDDCARRAAAPRARHAVDHNLPKGDQVPRKSELGLLRHQIGLRRPSKSIREMIGGMPEVFGKLAPCLLMSPLSIAQYLPADQALFDVVVFDEASQIATWDAIGAIARGRQTVIVGDPKQLPPTNFFGKAESDEDNAELQDHEKDLESILDEAKASGLPTLQLNWHYRSQHESLIAFSNWNYYDNKLVSTLR